MVLRFLLAALAMAALASSPASAKCTFTGVATQPLKPVVGDGSGTTPPTTPSQPPSDKPAEKPTEKPADTATPATPGGPAQPPAPAVPPTSPETGSESAGLPSGMTGPGFAYYPPGDLLPQDAGRGRKGDRFVYMKDMIYPLKLGDGIHPHMNSQIWGHGGGGWLKQKGAGGTECDPPNYDPMLQRDNYCEVRDNDSTHKMPLCPKGYGHQGQDIRPPACPPANKWVAVATVDGTIQSVTGFSYLTLKGNDGTVYGYLHMAPGTVKVKQGDKVKQGQVLGAVSNVMDYSAGGTTYHLHFQVKQQIKVNGKTLNVYVPVYTSLIASYRKSKGLDPGIDKDGNLIIDPTFEIGVAKPQQPEPGKTAEKPGEQKPEQPKPSEPAPAPEKKSETPPPAPAPAPEPPKPSEPAPAPEKKAETPPPAPAPAPESPKPSEPAPAPEKKTETPPPAPAPAPEPPKPSEPAPAPEKKAETPPPAPAPAPAPPKPSEPAPSEYPVPPPAEPPSKTEAPAPAPAPAPPPPAAPDKPAEAKPGWWSTIKGKVGGWWDYWRGNK